MPQGDRLLIRTNQDRVPHNQRVDDDLEISAKDVRSFLEDAILNTGKYGAMSEFNRTEAAQCYQKDSFNRNIEHVVIGH